MNGSNFGHIPALLIWSNMWKRSSRISAKNIKLILYRYLSLRCKSRAWPCVPTASGCWSIAMRVGCRCPTAQSTSATRPIIGLWEGGRTMPARTGEEYITGLKEHPREVWIDGEQVQDVTTHPALRNGVRSVAALYDMQHDPALREAMTYPSPTTGHPVGLSFLMPQSVADLERRRTMMAHWAWASCGMMGRSPDFLNVLFTAWAGAADYFAQNRPEFKHNVLHY